MKKLTLLGVAAVLMAPALVTAANAQSADVNIRVGTPGYHSGYYHSGVRTYAYSPSHCRTVTVRTKQANGVIKIKKVRRCG